jgi:hypothetical protein
MLSTRKQETVSHRRFWGGSRCADGNAEDKDEIACMPFVIFVRAQADGPVQKRPFVPYAS